MSYFKWWIAGGNNQVGANAHVVQYIYEGTDGEEKETCFIQELGIDFADRHKKDDPDYFYPDVTDHLMKYEEKFDNGKTLAKAIVLTHGHLDHVGAIAVLAKEGYKLPKIYCSRRSMTIIKEMLRSMEVETSLDFKIINPSKPETCEIKMNDYLTLHWYPVSHSISGSGAFMYIAKAPDDEKPIRVCFQIDFKTDNTVLLEPGYNRSLIQDMGKEEISTCFMESTRATEPGKNPTEMTVMDNIDKIIKKHTDKRIVATTMASNDQRLAVFIYLAHKNDRKFVYYGRSMENTIKIMKDDIAKAIKDRFNVDIELDDTIINGKTTDMDDFPASQQLVMLTGTQAENGAAMTLASNEEHKNFLFKQDDIVLDSASIIPGSEDFVFPMMKRVSEIVAKVYMPPSVKIHASGHGLRDELKEFLGDIAKTNLKSFITIHGEVEHREGSKSLAEEVNKDIEYYGHEKFNIITPKNGDIIRIDINGAEIIDNDDKEFLTYTVPEEEF